MRKDRGRNGGGIAFAGATLLFGLLLLAGGACARDLSLPHEEQWTGDLDAMVERHRIRFLVVFNKMGYFLDGGTQRGVSYELARLFEKELNKKRGKKILKVRVLFIPVTRDQLLPALLEGRGDIAAANLTITPERSKQVGFSTPWLRDVSELVVTGPGGPELERLEDLAGRTLHVRRSSSYYESLLRLNRGFEQAGREPVELVLADELQEDADLLEMVNAGLIPAVVVDSHKAAFWAQIFPDIRVHEGIAVNRGGEIAWAIRKDSPQLKAAVDDFVARHGKGSLMGNILYQRYLKTNRWARNNLAEKELAKFQAVVAIFRRYADRYDFDWLMLAALAYQESGLDNAKRSPDGAVGIMQILPSTARDPNVDIRDIKKLENNVHAGTKYLRFLYDRYFAAEPMNDLNRMLFAFAAYNAGPAKVRGLRREAGRMGLDPNAWFRNVEVAAARRIGRETVQYVGNIYKYYVAYRLVLEKMRLRGDFPPRPRGEAGARE